MTTTLRLSQERAIILFRTLATWEARHLYDFVSAISTMYALTLVCVEDVTHRERISAFFRRGVSLFDEETTWAPFPTLEYLLHLDANRHALLRRFEEEYKVRRHHRLTIERIEIASPGIISFEGLAPIVEQLRELIKDVWYRNHAEKQQGRIQLEERTLDLQERIAKQRAREIQYATDYLRALKGYNRLAGHPGNRFVSEAAGILALSLRDLDDLVTSGLLEESPEELDPDL